MAVSTFGIFWKTGPEKCSVDCYLLSQFSSISDLQEDFKALLCDGSCKRMCCDCLKISNSEYDLLVKILEMV